MQTKDYDVIIIGERHKNPEHIKKEEEIIRKFDPKYILFEGFVDYSQDEIREFIDRNINSTNLSAHIKNYIPLFKAMKESGAVIEGCDSKQLQDKCDEYEITIDDYAKGIDHILRKAEQLREILKKRERYMVNKIVETSKKGKTIAIVGIGHLEGISKELNKCNNIRVKYFQLDKGS